MGENCFLRAPRFARRRAGCVRPRFRRAVAFTSVAAGSLLAIASPVTPTAPQTPSGEPTVAGPPRLGVHITHGNSYSGRLQRNASNLETESELLPAQAPPTRTSFMTSWMPSRGAAGYRLDISTSAAFDSYVPGWRDVDVGNATGRAVTGLKQGTKYFYRVRAYIAGGTSSNSEVMSATTSATPGLIIHAVFDASITGSSHAAEIEATINRAIAIYESLFDDRVTVNIFFRYATTVTSGDVIASSRYPLYPIQWRPYVAALFADAKSTNDLTANESISVNANVGVFGKTIDLSSANGRALQFNTPAAMTSTGIVQAGGEYDGIVTLNSGQSFQFTRPARAGAYDAQRVVEHEIDEVLGLGAVADSNTDYERPQDLFAWDSAGSRSWSSGPGSTRYFSIDGGKTKIVSFNQDSQGDLGDWASGTCPQTTPYVQNAFACTGQASDISTSSPEGVALDVIGYDLAGLGLGFRRSHSIIADFNGDGYLDYLLYSRTTRQTALWYLDSNGSFLAGEYGPTIAAGWSLVDAADFDGDGHPDYLLVNPTTGRTAIWYLSGGAFVRGAYGPSLPLGWKLIAASDFNADGKPDFVLYNPSNHKTAIWYLNNTVVVSSQFGPTLPSGWELVDVPDWDRNGQKDYLLFSIASEQTAIWYLSAGTFVSSAYVTNSGIPWDGIITQLTGAGSFDQSGAINCLVSEREWYSLNHWAEIWSESYNDFNQGSSLTVPQGWSLADP